MIGAVLLVGWQITFALPGTVIAPTHRVTASVGIYGEPRFFFYLKHLGLLPIAAVPPPRQDTVAEARRILREAPETLYMDVGLTFRSGDRGRVFLYFVDSLIGGNAISPRIRPAAVGAFIGALLLLWWSAWRSRRALVGAALVIFLGSDPFELHAVYAEENVFGWPIIAMVLVLGLNFGLLVPRVAGERRFRRALLLAVGTGFLLATLRTVRSEPAVLLASASLLYLTASGLRALERVGLVLAAVAVFVTAGAGYGAYFRHKTAGARDVIAAAHGVPYTGPTEIYHEFWHPVFCGLGDYDTKYGYQWDDRVAYAYAKPVLERRAGRRLPLNPSFWAQSESYDGKGRYPVTFFETPGYHAVIREKVLGDIGRDPAWYLGILWERTKRIFRETTPVSVAIAGRTAGLEWEWLGACALPLLLLLLVRRDGFRTKLLLFSTPLSLNALLVYSDKGMTWYTCFHLFGAALVVAGALQVTVFAVRHARRRFRAHAR